MSGSRPGLLYILRKNFSDRLFSNIIQNVLFNVMVTSEKCFVTPKGQKHCSGENFPVKCKSECDDKFTFIKSFHVTGKKKKKKLM